MATRTRFSLGLLLSALLVGGAFFFNPASAQRADSASRPARQTTPTGQTATRLADGRVLLLGGEGQNGVTGAASIVDPRTGQSISLPTSLTIPRADHTATVLPDGSVLVIGGRTKDGMAPIPEVFDPATQTFRTAPMTGSGFRFGHTATLLTDGRVLVVGGSSIDGKPQATEVWDINSGTAAPMPGSIDRQGHTATLLGDGRVLIEGGRGSDAQPGEVSLIVDPSARTVVESRGPRPIDETFVVAASSPADGARDVPLEVRIGLRFSEPLRAGAITEQTVVLLGPDGVVRTNVIVAEHGRLAFVWPLDPLVEEQAYTLSIRGAVSERGMAIVPANITFTTVASKPGADAVDTEAWRPGTGKDGWRSGRGQSPWETLAPLQAPDGVTAVSGRVLRLDGRPLADVTLEMEGHKAQTDRTGRFLLRVEGLATGEHTLEIDARTANKPGRTYGFYEARTIVRAGGTNVLPFTVWSPLIDTVHQVTIASPTLRETLVTTPLIPGLELHLPAGTVIRDEEGQVARTVSITPVPLDRTPFPLPENATFSMFFTIQPGGAYLQTPGPTKGGWLVYPRVGKSQPGRRVQFFNYDPDDKGWYSYGMGTVTATQIVPDAKTRIYGFTGASFNDGTMPPSAGPPPGDCCGNGGDPVNLTTGIFTYEMTDLVVNDVMPLALTRTYASQDTDPLSPRAFGIGMTMAYSIFLHSEVNWQEADLILPDGGRVHYLRTAESGANWWQTIFEHTTSPTDFYKSRISFWGNIAGIGGWELKQKDGTVYVFGHQAPLQAIRDRNGNEIRLTWSDVSAYGSGKGNLLRVTSPNGRWIAFTYYAGTGLVQTASDNIGRTVNYVYDAGGRLWKVTDPLNHVTEYTYDDNNRMIKIKNRNGVEYVTNEYTTTTDAPTPVGWVKKQTHADGGVYEFTYSVLNGKSTQTDVKDPRGYVRRATFNGAGYTIDNVRALGTNEEQMTSSVRPQSDNFITTSADAVQQVVYTYDSSGNTTAITRCSATQSPCATGVPNSETTRYDYEATFNQVVSITDSLSHVTAFEYDARGNLAVIRDPLQHESSFTYNSAGQLTSITDARHHTTTFGYTAGYATSVTDPIGRSTTRFLDGIGRVIATTNALGQTTQFSYDANGQLVMKSDPSGDQTIIDYFPEGELHQVSDANQHATTYTYDVMGRLVTRADPLGRTERFTYDVAGNLIQSVDRKGQAATRTYDSLGRQMNLSFSDGSLVTYTYDNRDRITEIVDSTSGTMTRSFDPFDRIISESTVSAQVDYTYDSAGRVSTRMIAGQPTATYIYDDADRLTQVATDIAAVSLEYNDTNQKVRVTLPNGVVTESDYDDANQLIALTYRHGEDILGDLAYTYDPVGKRTSVSGSWARTELPPPVTSAIYDAANELTTWGNQWRQYDSNGSLTSDGFNSYLWDGRHRLVEVAGARTGVFGYDPVGRRVVSSIGGSTTNYAYDGDNVVSELRGSELTTLIAVGLDGWAAKTKASGSSFFLTDSLGSTIALTNAVGAVETQYSYEPFGMAREIGTGSGTIKYTGREEDSSGSYYYRSRYYDASSARFLSEDPIQWAGGNNFYSYVGNAPTVFWDPFGLQPSKPGAAPKMPDARPDPRCCSKSKIRERTSQVAGYVNDTKNGRMPKGSVAGINGGSAICDPLTHWCQPTAIPPVTLFNPGCAFDDKCVNYCCRQHEWFHFTDQRPWNLEWTTPAITIFTEGPAYEVELKCLKSFR